jgi:hypothetical protein
MWREVGTWLYGLANGFPPFEYARQLDHVALGLKTAALVNLKKSGGRGTSNPDEIRDWAARTRELWLEEIEILDPSIIICGGTFRIVEPLLSLQRRHSGSGVDFAVLPGGNRERILVDFVHPAARMHSAAMYAWFMATIRTLLAEIGSTLP